MRNRFDRRTGTCSRKPGNQELKGDLFEHGKEPDHPRGFCCMTARISDWRMDHVAKQVNGGAVIAYPTEGVWGLGCSPHSLSAVSRILKLKNRSWDRGLIMVASSIEQLKPFLTGLSDEMRDQLERDWPGPVTYLVPDNGCCPLWIKGTHDSVALRVSSHPVIQDLCQRLNSPLVSTSANPTGRVAAISPLQVRKNFPAGIDAVVPGTVTDRRSVSEIRDLNTGKVLRTRNSG